MNNESLVLRVAGRPVGRYVTRPELPPRLSPRPYLHPVTTLAGTTVTELTPADHAHHLGVGVAVPDVEGHNFWGGRTYVRDQGPTELDNHGAQRHSAFQLSDPDGFVEELRWIAAGGELLRERRTVAATELTDSVRAVVLVSENVKSNAQAVSVSSTAATVRRSRSSSPPAATQRSSSTKPSGSRSWKELWRWAPWLSSSVGPWSRT